MNFSCEKSTLLNAVTTVSKALPARAVNPITEGILLTATEGKVTLTATDSSLTIITSISAEVFEEGEIVLAGKFFGEIVRKMPEGVVQVNGNLSSGVSISSNFAKMSIAAMDANEYPNLPAVNREEFFTIPQNQLKEVINQTMFATAADESRPILTGCLFELEGERLRVVAIDGYRLALRDSFIEPVDEKISAIIPASALSEITKIVTDTDALVRIYLQKSYCVIELEETKIITRLIEGKFINYEPIIPKTFTSNITLSRLDLLEAIDRAWLVVRENEHQKFIVLSFKNDKIIITSRSETSNAYEEVNFSGTADQIEMAFNPRFFVECLKNISDEFISFSFSTVLSPTVIKPIDGEKFVYLILPVKL